MSEIKWVSRDLTLPNYISIWDKKPVWDKFYRWWYTNAGETRIEVETFRKEYGFILKKGECIKVRDKRKIKELR